MTSGQAFGRRQGTVDANLERITACVQARQDTENAIAEHVAKARRAGATWQQIADALKVTRQSAWETWHDRVDA